MGIGKNEILEAVSAMSVMDLMEMVKAIETRFNVSAALSSAPAVVVAPKAEEQTEFSVRLTSAGVNRVSVIKAVREITGFGLKEAKDVVDVGVAIVIEGRSKEDAKLALDKLIAAGAQAEMV